MTTTFQKALLITELQKPLSLVHDWPIPEPGANQVQIKVTVAGINPHDMKSREMGLFTTNNLPAVVTNDVVGKVVKLGPGVSDLAIGDRIVTQGSFGPDWKQNGLQEYAIADRALLSKIPESITDDQAATLPTNIMAPFVALFYNLKIPAPWTPEAKAFDYAGITLLVFGGGSNCGKFGVQLAKLANIGRIVVVGGDETELKSYGATHVIDRHADYDTLLGRIRHVVGDDLVYAYDAVSTPEEVILPLNALSNSKKGTVARLLPIGPVDRSKVVGKNAGFEVSDVFGMAHRHLELAAGFWSRLPEYLESGRIKPLAYVVKEGLTESNVNEVLDAYRDGKRVVKTHIHL